MDKLCRIRSYKHTALNLVDQLMNFKLKPAKISQSFKRNSSVAIVIRAIKDNEPEILYLKRSIRENDKWSGHVSFPGGHREENETPLQTSIRECQEETGIDLNSDSFKLIGELNSRAAYGDGHRLSLGIKPFIFWQTTNEEIEMDLDESEVAAAKWCPISQFMCENSMDRDKIHMNYIIPKFLKIIPNGLRNVVGLNNGMNFPSIDLMSRDEIMNDENDDDTIENQKLVFRLWGGTLRITSDMLFQTGILPQAISWPPLAFHKAPVFNKTVLAAYLGFIEVKQMIQHCFGVKHRSVQLTYNSFAFSLVALFPILCALLLL
eukprot:TRINITY_DN775918_c0_g1_i1.p1 TRINITY_DN775918_c0_g1~~TRINITY_DN775918_c0_g1_i1.p1  ORF type:complete len:320 (+),score=55.99 TRINITY_DN775918_c0_g1_i1:181-1140(+)